MDAVWKDWQSISSWEFYIWWQVLISLYPTVQLSEVLHCWSLPMTYDLKRQQREMKINLNAIPFFIHPKKKKGQLWLSTLSQSLTSVFIKEIKTILFWKGERYVPCLTVLIQLIVGPVELYKKKTNLRA